MTEELESLINPIASTVHEEIEETEETSTSDQLAPPTIADIVKSEESIVLPQLTSSIETKELISQPIQITDIKLNEPEQTIISTQFPTLVPAETTPTIIAADEEAKKINMIITEVCFSISLRFDQRAENEFEQTNRKLLTVHLLTVNNEITLYSQYCIDGGHLCSANIE